MKSNWKMHLVPAVMGILIPGTIAAAALPGKPAEASIVFTEKAENEPSGTRPFKSDEFCDMVIRVSTQDEGIREMNLEDYVRGVVLAEMPCGFAPEAHKAQAVVARTYTLHRCETGTRHSGAEVCTDPGCCQAYLSDSDFIAKGGTSEELEKIRKELLQTCGQILLYQGHPIDATYFSCSGGRTEDALAVWGTDIPYLQSTVSPGEEEAAHYKDCLFFTADEFCSLIGENLKGTPDTWLGKISHTAGGGVDTLEIGGKRYKGTQFRKLLGLRSTAFEIEPCETGIMIETRGFGHRVGMSQYGAEAMAQAGKNYREILEHYYCNTVLQTYSPNN